MVYIVVGGMHLRRISERLIYGQNNEINRWTNDTTSYYLHILLINQYWFEKSGLWLMLIFMAYQI